MVFKCPGQDDRNVRAETITCPECTYAVEIFSDENKAKCPHCRNIVCRDMLPSCVQWCKAARECIGEEKWNKLIKGG